MEYQISALARHFKLSRSTLLYYDSIGLLSPSGRSGSNYRKYSQADFKKLEQICLLRESGLTLANIKDLIAAPRNKKRALLEQRLDGINQEIKQLREQQKFIVGLLGNKKLLKSSRFLTKANWVDLLRKAGLDENGMLKWHSEFERAQPEAHQDFLESLGLESDEIGRIREHSLGAGKK